MQQQHRRRHRRWQPIGGEPVEDQDARDLRVVREDHDRAELAHAPRPGQDAAGQDAAAGERQGDAPEALPGVVAQRAGDALQLRVHGGEGLARPAHQQRRRHEQHSRHDARHMAHELEARRRERASHHRMPPEKEEQRDAGHRMRDHHREVDDAEQQPPAGKSGPGQEVAKRHTEQRGDQGRGRGADHRERDRCLQLGVGERAAEARMATP